MWPDPGEALSRTVEAEGAIADLYAESLRRWAPSARAAVLPSLTAAALPPDPAAVQQQQVVDEWSTATETVIVAGVALLWTAALVEAMDALGIPLPELPTERSDRQAYVAVREAFMEDRAVVRTILAAVDMTRDQLADAFDVVEATTSLRAARDLVVDAQRESAAHIPAVVSEKMAAAVREVGLDIDPELTAQDQRAAASMALDPSGTDMRDIARVSGYQAAAVQNHAVVTAAAQQNEEFGEELEKTWIATLDGKTRPTHWAADGQRVPLAGKFTVGGEQMEFPGDLTASAAERINCRCRVGVLAKDEQLPDEVDRHTERLDGRDSVAINRDGRTQAEEIERRRDAGNIRARDDQDGIGRVASGGWAAPSEQEHDMPPKPSDLAAKTATTLADDATESDETYLTFTDALFAVTGVPTSDGRMLASDIELSFRDTPLPLQWCEEMEGGHYGSVTVGVIETITFAKGEVRASGYMLNNDNALKAIDLVSHGVNNPSVDLGDAEIVWTDADGTPVTDETYEEGMELFYTVLKAEVLATTIVAIPAFGETRIRLNEQRESRDKALVAALVASMSSDFKPPVYDPALFADPKLSGPTRLMIAEDGHVFGHVASWKDQHRSVGLGDIKPPRSRTGYEHFHSSPGVHLSDGSILPVGRLTVGIGHAPTMGVSSAAAQAHYDNVDACWAIGRIGEDRHGIYFSGVVAPWATPEKVQMGLASPLSGDWRPIGPFGDNLELVAVLSVNTPGFLCKMATDDQGRPLAMVASLAPSPRTQAGGGEHLSIGEIKAAMAEVLAESARNTELAARRDAALALAQETVGDPPPELTPTERVEQLLAEAGV